MHTICAALNGYFKIPLTCFLDLFYSSSAQISAVLPSSADCGPGASESMADRGPGASESSSHTAFSSPTGGSNATQSLSTTKQKPPETSAVDDGETETITSEESVSEETPDPQQFIPAPEEENDKDPSATTIPEMSGLSFSLTECKMMTTDERHITDSWLNAKFGDERTTVVRSLFKNLEVMIATQLMTLENFDRVVELVTSWILLVMRLVEEGKKRKTGGREAFAIMGHATTRNGTYSWQERREEISFISATFQETITRLQESLHAQYLAMKDASLNTNTNPTQTQKT